MPKIPMLPRRKKGLALEARKRRGKRQKRWTETERDLALRIFEHARGKDINSVDAAGEAGVPLTTIQRWIRARGPNSKEEGLPQEIINIDQAFQLLIGIDKFDIYDYLVAVFKFASWIRWPNDIENQNAAVLSYLVHYVSLDSGSVSIADLAPPIRDRLLKSLKFDLLRRAFSFKAIDFPWFDINNLDDQPHTEIDAISDIVSYFLSEDTSDNRYVSLEKAYYLTKNSAFTYNWIVSPKTFRRLWRDYAPAAAFLYAGSLPQSPNWNLDPTSDFFVEDVRRILDHRDKVPTYFAHCKWVLEELRTRLDPRAIRVIDFPNLPDSLPSKPLERQPLSKITKALLREYQPGENRLYHVELPLW